MCAHCLDAALHTVHFVQPHAGQVAPDAQMFDGSGPDRQGDVGNSMRALFRGVGDRDIGGPLSSHIHAPLYV